ncbi:MAG: Ni,Fe-hydrogenase III large subunit [Candidatus Moranbacteria bacterium GW2011_GWE1_35_17]|nr:MAG: Ni,Fe-hydrogenase III large subunit [Candidatus Moranbacteria bacterium GW2011_GWE1_35_17]
MGEKNNMKIQEILKELNILETSLGGDDLVLAKVSRNDLAVVATKLVEKYKLPLSLLFGTDDRKDLAESEADHRAGKNSFGVHVIFSLDKENKWLKLSAEIPADDAQYPALTETIMASHWYERYLQDMFGIIPVGHPDLRRLVHHENIPENTHPLLKDFIWNTKLPKDNVPYPMNHVAGEGVFEIPVGPIHAGIIEPGHFRFNVAGERILTLEGKLFFTHKGVEKLMEGKTVSKALPFIERLSGDASASHALAYSEAVEKISSCKVSKRAQIIRMIITECERITMHVHDLANIGGMGTGYSFIAANGFRIKERMMRLSQEICGNRFWRGMIIPGGLSRDLSKEELDKILKISTEVWKEIDKIVAIALDSEGFLDRLQYTGELPKEAALAFGAVGLPARASMINRDVRRDHPYAAYGEFPICVITKKSQDVFARYRMRIKEIEQSIILLDTLVKNIKAGDVFKEVEIKDGFALGAVESWRGEILTALQIKDGVIERCFPRDPSFCNWALFGIMGPGNIVPDFPLINKSLNLSYSGNDM